MRIGQLACACGVSVETIRYYERRGLLRRPPRTPAGYRTYDPADIEAIATIRVGRRLGFTLAEIRRALALYDEGAAGGGRPPHARGSQSCLEEVLAIAGRKLEEMDAEIARRAKLRAELAEVIGSLRSAQRARAAGDGPAAAPRGRRAEPGGSRRRARNTAGVPSRREK